jgi:hypothetical protein
MSLLLYFIIYSPSLTPAPAGSTETIQKHILSTNGTPNDKSVALPGKIFYEIIKSQPQKTIAPLKQHYQDKLIY